MDIWGVEGMIAHSGLDYTFNVRLWVNARFHEFVKSIFVELGKIVQVLGSFHRIGECCFIIGVNNGHLLDGGAEGEPAIC